MGRLPQFVGQAALAAGVFAGGASLLNAGGASAACTGINEPLLISSLHNTNPQPTDANCSQVGPNPAFNTTYIIDINKASPEITTPVGVPQKVSYVLTNITGNAFKDVFYSVDIDVPLVNNLTKKVWAGTDSTGTLLANISGPSVDFTSFTPTSTIYVEDTYTLVNQGSQLDNYTNTFRQTPGPLPILGAGAAFGFSRKLRSRIKAGRTA